MTAKKITKPRRATASPAAGAVVPWERGGRAAVWKVIQRGAGKNLPVVFDFDNTITRHDLGEATLACLVHSGRLTPKTLPKGISPAFRADGKPRRDLNSFPSLVDYYLALLHPTAHGPADPRPYATSYTWALEVMSGMRVAEVVAATRKVLALSRAKKPTAIRVTPKGTPIPIPRFHPEVVELLAELIRHAYDVWIVSASNVWTVRTAVLEALNPLLRAHGAGGGIRGDQVLGVSCLLADAKDRLYKDALLVRENSEYAQLQTQALNQFKLTNRLAYPLPTYSGKVACILDAIGRRPYLGAGDSHGDRAMLAICDHQLWVSRDSAAPEQVAVRLVRSEFENGWPLNYLRETIAITSAPKASKRSVKTS